MLRARLIRPLTTTLLGSLTGLAIPCAAESEDRISAEPSIRFQYDASWTKLPGEVVEDQDYLRRMRLGLSGELPEGANYKAEIDVDKDGRVEITSAYVDVRIAQGITIRLGQDKPPVSLEEMTSSGEIVFTERASFTDSFGFDRRLGVSVKTEHNHLTFSLGAYGENLDRKPFGGGYVLAGRAVVAVPVEWGSLHLGASARFRQGADGQMFSYEAPFPSRIATGLAEGDTRADRDTFVGAELAASWQGLWAAGELGHLRADCDCPDDAGWGGYVSAGVTLWGERTLSGGRLAGPEVRAPLGEGGYGVVGLSARLDRIDLPHSVSGSGSAETIHAGIDWWPQSRVRLMAAVFDARGSGVSWTQLPAQGRSARGGMVRLQLSY